MAGGCGHRPEPLRSTDLDYIAMRAHTHLDDLGTVERTEVLEEVAAVLDEIAAEHDGSLIDVLARR